MGDRVGTVRTTGKIGEILTFLEFLRESFYCASFRENENRVQKINLLWLFFLTDKLGNASGCIPILPVTHQ